MQSAGSEMGEEIETAGFTRDDFLRFADRLIEETEIARGLFVTDGFSQSGHTLGFEIECWILDHNYFPASINQRLLETLANPLVVPELSRFNLELNCEPLRLDGDVLSRAATALSQLWTECNAVAHTLDANMVMIGTLPTICDEDLTLDNMSPLNRFYALNREVLRRRHGQALCVDIAGRDHLISEHRDVMLEAATTSFQIHLKAPADLAHLYYNASIAISGPVLAACANSPFLFGKCLWEETRIPLFEQAVAVPGASGASRRVSMGPGYLTTSCLEVFEQNRCEYPVLLPMSYDDLPAALRHLRLHNGTIWRWNRPLIGFDRDGAPHLRIEHRVLPAGPTICDMIANAALYLGLVRYVALSGHGDAGGLPYADALHNFYAAARHGLDATIVWPSTGAIAADVLLLERLIPNAREGLADLGIDDSDGSFLDIVEARVRSRQTGASWQRKAFEARGRDMYKLMAAYCERQRSDAPVHQWEL
jgi:gamma-glutamyl:cysteine ligase YbdK (ATP-grasp superfamily)